MEIHCSPLSFFKTGKVATWRTSLIFNRFIRAFCCCCCSFKPLVSSLWAQEKNNKSWPYGIICVQPLFYVIYMYESISLNNPIRWIPLWSPFSMSRNWGTQVIQRAQGHWAISGGSWDSNPRSLASYIKEESAQFRCRVHLGELWRKSLIFSECENLRTYTGPGICQGR